MFYFASNESSTGLVHGQHYVVKDVADNDGDGVNDRFKIAIYDSNGTAQNITMSAAAAQNVSFTKVEKGFKLQVHYIPLNIQKYFKKKYRLNKNDCPNSLRFYNEAISIPIYYGIKSKIINRFCTLLSGFIKKNQLI